MIKIVNWLLTRRCNIRCHSCRIVSNYNFKPKNYPNISYYHNNEMSATYIKDMIIRFKKHNPNIFHIFYGGEPTLRNDIIDIIKFCNSNDVLYTIISNMMDPQKITNILDHVTIRGLTGSIDPIIIKNSNCNDKSRYNKSSQAFKLLSNIVSKKLVDDVVAEVTIDKQCLNDVPKLIELLSKNNIVSSITFIDISKTRYYDFSNIVNPDILVTKQEAKKVIDKIKNYKIHIPEMVSKIVDNLPSELDCEIDKHIHNLTIDTDGTLRLCLRIRGFLNMSCDKIIDTNGTLKNIFQEKIKLEKKKLCKGCNWSCMIMSRDYNENQILNH